MSNNLDTEMMRSGPPLDFGSISFDVPTILADGLAEAVTLEQIKAELAKKGIPLQTTLPPEPKVVAPVTNRGQLMAVVAMAAKSPHVALTRNKQTGVVSVVAQTVRQEPESDTITP